MNILKRLIVPMGLLSVLCGIPTMAQITNKVTFDAPSAFYAGNARMPVGSYTATRSVRRRRRQPLVGRRCQPLTLGLRRV